MPKDVLFATVQMQTTNKQKFSKTINLNENDIDLQFFPESGELVQGLQSKVGFKAINSKGKGQIVHGEIVDEQDSVVASFNSNLLGMGSFVLPRADSLKGYFARLNGSPDEKQILLYALPKVATIGNLLNVRKRDGEILCSAYSNYLDNDSIYLRISSRGINYYNLKVGLKNNAFTLKLGEDKIPAGIVSFKMMDELERPLAERLFFNDWRKDLINIDISSNKSTFEKRELSSLAFKTTDSKGNAVHANLSLLVINKKQKGEIQNTRQNILSYFLLDSDLKGEIENPGYYFSSDSIKCNDLDALMLTQGWRKYNYSKSINKINYLPERKLSVSGYVSSLFAKEKRKKVNLTMMTFGENKIVSSQLTDSLGRFKFNLDDEYGQRMNILLQTSKKHGKNKNFNIFLNKNKSLPVFFSQARTIDDVEEPIIKYVEKEKERKKIDDAFPLQAGNIQIEEVTVNAYELTPNRKKVMEKFGKPSEVIEGKEILEKEQKWSYGLYSVLLFNYGNKVEITPDSADYLVARVLNSEPTLLVIDGIPVKSYEYEFVPNIPTSTVRSFEIIEYADNFIDLYMDAYPFEDVITAPTVGNVIAIYTYSGKGIYGVIEPIGIKQASVPVFSAPREFYCPKYETDLSKASYKPDLRALVYWNPELLTDSLGYASASFYNADNVGEMMVVVEAIAMDGQIGYKEFEYKVEGSEKEIILDY